MSEKKDMNVEMLVENLVERAKELNCVYRAEEILRDYDADLDGVFQQLLEIIPSGWQYSEYCLARIVFEGDTFESEGFEVTPCCQTVDIMVDGKKAGQIEVYYAQSDVLVKQCPFLPEEKKLLGTIADRLSHYITHRRLKTVLSNWKNAVEKIDERRDWTIVIEMVKRSDSSLFLRISRKMLNHLCWIGIPQAREQLQNFGDSRSESEQDMNRPMHKKNMNSLIALSDQTFAIAADNIPHQEILSLVQKWIQEDKLNYLILTLESLATSLGDIQNAITRYYHLDLDKIELSEYVRKNINVLCILRFLTEQLEFINIAKDFVTLSNFYDLVQHIIFPVNSHGKIGGKAAGIFLAHNILRNLGDDEMSAIRIPRTWYISSDTLHHFLYYNDLKEAIEQKYKSIEQVREEYNNLIQIFKNSFFPPEIIKGFALALDDLGDQPIIVRSSSLLEDRIGAAFSGKYKSLFLANQGTREERLAALMDAVAEVYASTFGPDPIEYRRERGLLDFHEEMAIIIQEVVGQRAGRYFFPAFAGVAFSSNEFRWSPRIKREDGLIRLVPGLGTRAVDRLADDYPILIAPGQPGLKVNVTADEQFRYSPRKIDVINLETNQFETKDMDELVRECGRDYPAIEKVVSVYSEGIFTTKSRFNLDFKRDDTVVTFDGLRTGTKFIERMGKILDTLKEKMHGPVDIEFAHNGEYIYLLQCRAQSYTHDVAPTPIPKDINEASIVFSANRYISNGRVPDITHIVYVDPEGYAGLESVEEMRTVGKAVGRLNDILPKRRFILMGPGRWGSRGDIRLGVPITYSDINNTAMLIEVARQKGNYTPDLSFGTHFFQDLVEASIRYLPLYPDDESVEFNERFLRGAHNILEDLLPNFKRLTHVVRVINVPRESDGKVLRVAMNAELDEALAYLSAPSNEAAPQIVQAEETTPQSENHWRWRYRMAEHIAKQLHIERFGVVAIYVFGSTKNANAGPASDIDLLLHVNGDETQKRELTAWLDGWSRCLSEINYLKTGYKTSGLLDVHLVTDQDIADKTSFAIKIGAITDAARLLRKA
ncbi:MAG: nucleotidyltransferase domain-containing protein [Candidatus Cloacimonetes bacterium]|nr:nucleotidyltransferase domain-containing protein [Candidatus Cloacimonadota bacterium]